MRRVEEFLRDSAQQFPDKVALVAGAERFTYRRLDEMSDALASGLISAGLTRGDRVLIFMDNCWQTAVSLFGVLKAGGVFVPVNPSTKADKLAYMLNNCRASALLTLDRLAPVAATALEHAPSTSICAVSGSQPCRTLPKALHFERLVDAEAISPLPDAGLILDLAMVIYTSGSTGFPKGVMMTHQNMAFAADSITSYLESTSDDVIMNVLPLSFDYGLYQLLMAFKTGATLVLEKSFAFPQVIFDKIRAEKVTGFPLVPTMAALILQRHDLEPGFLPSVRYLTNTAAALPPAHILRLQALFPQAKVFSMYGLTECKRCTYLPPEQIPSRTGSVGIAIPGTEAFVVDDAGHRVPPHEVGELVIRGPHVMKGYWENPDATDHALRPGPFRWEKVLYTGDLFRCDEDGFLYFVGRKDDIIKTRGEKVSPKEVENVLYALKGVREAAVIGIPDPVLGQALKAIVALDAGVDLDASLIIRHCSQHLEDFMVPKLIDIRRDLPKSENGKINRRQIAAELEMI